MQTIGERLEEARKRKGISIREAAEATKIRGDYLQKFESNQFDLGLAELYVRGFLRSYALFLKLPAEKIVNDFNALTAGSTSSRRAPSREVYGRMDLSVASSESPESGAAPSQAGSAEPENASTRRVPPTFTRGGGSIPQGPAIDPRLVVKGAIGVIALVLLVLVVLGIKSMMSSKSAAPASQANAPAAQAQTMLTLTALSPISVEVAIPRPDNPDLPGQVLFSGPLDTGQVRQVPRTGELLVTTSAAEYLELMANGNRISLKEKGYSGKQTVRIPAP